MLELSNYLFSPLIDYHRPYESIHLDLSMPIQNHLPIDEDTISLIIIQYYLDIILNPSLFIRSIYQLNLKLLKALFLKLSNWFLG